VSRISDRLQALRERGETGLIVYITAGDPDLETTERLVYALEDAGVDVLELGVPFTDPLADGPTIQAATERALASGITLRGILDLVRRVRERSELPILLMTYYNPVFHLGHEQVAQEAQAAGVDGFLITDLPPEEAADWKAAADGAGLDTIFLLAPTSTSERIDIACRQATGFVYCVARTGVTGARTELPPDLQALIERIRARTESPLAVGFGISTPEHVRQVGQWADAAVVGSAIVKVIAEQGRDCVGPVAELGRSLKGGAREGPRQS